MPKKVSGGWVAPLQRDTKFRVDGNKPSGLYIHGNRGRGVFLTYAGVENAAAYLFSLPLDQDALRDLAEAIRNFADDAKIFPS